MRASHSSSTSTTRCAPADDPARRVSRARQATGIWPIRCWNSTPISARFSTTLKELGVADNTIVVFSGDNGPEEMEPWRGSGGPWQGSYFTGMEGSLRTPAIVRYPGHVPAGQVSNEIVHITDMFTTITGWAGLEMPKDRVIDGVDQRAFLEGKQKNSNRDGFLYWMNDTLYGVKWRKFKMVMVEQKTLTDPALHLATPHIINLDPIRRNANLRLSLRAYLGRGTHRKTLRRVSGKRETRTAHPGWRAARLRAEEAVSLHDEHWNRHTNTTFSRPRSVSHWHSQPPPPTVRKAAWATTRPARSRPSWMSCRASRALASFNYFVLLQRQRERQSPVTPRRASSPQR